MLDRTGKVLFYYNATYVSRSGKIKYFVLFPLLLFLLGFIWRLIASLCWYCFTTKNNLLFHEKIMKRTFVQ